MANNGRFYDTKNTSDKYFTKKQIAAIEQKPGESTEQYFRRLAKQSDQRLVRLEKLEKEKGFENVTKWAYANAVYDIKAMHGDNAKRFNIAPKRLASGEFSEKNMQMQIAIMKKFLLSPTSQKSTIIKSYKNKVNTINKKYGTDFTWQELANFFDTDMDKKLDLQYGSKVKMKAIGMIQRNNWKTKEDIEESIIKASESNMKVKDSEVIAMAKNLVDKHGDDISKFFLINRSNNEGE